MQLRSRASHGSPDSRIHRRLVAATRYLVKGDGSCERMPYCPPAIPGALSPTVAPSCLRDGRKETALTAIDLCAVSHGRHGSFRRTCSYTSQRESASETSHTPPMITLTLERHSLATLLSTAAGATLATCERGCRNCPVRLFSIGVRRTPCGNAAAFRKNSMITPQVCAAAYRYRLL